jgi:hypothetical protein
MDAVIEVACPSSRCGGKYWAQQGRAVAALVLSLCLGGPALAADDASSCAEGIAMIRDSLVSNPPEGAVPKLKKALRNAEREQREGEFDECLDAVGDARKVLGQ